jgi:hypothetical protein
VKEANPQRLPEQDGDKRTDDDGDQGDHVDRSLLEKGECYAEEQRHVHRLANDVPTDWVWYDPSARILGCHQEAGTDDGQNDTQSSMMHRPAHGVAQDD